MDLSGKAKEGTKHLPEWFWNLSRRQKKHLLAGFWDGDGGRFGESSSCVTFLQKSKGLISELGLALQSLGAYPTLRKSLPPHVGLESSLSGSKSASVIASFPLQDEKKLQSAKQCVSKQNVPKELRQFTRGLWASKAFWKMAAQKGKNSDIFGTLCREVGKDNCSASQYEQNS